MASHGASIETIGWPRSKPWCGLRTLQWASRPPVNLTGRGMAPQSSHGWASECFRGPRGPQSTSLGVAWRLNRDGGMASNRFVGFEAPNQLDWASHGASIDTVERPHSASVDFDAPNQLDWASHGASIEPWRGSRMLVTRA